MRSLEYAIVESLAAIKRNFLISLASIVTVALTLGILGGFVLSALAIDSVVRSELDKFEISVWMKKELTNDEAQAYKSKIRALPHVLSVRFMSSDDTWKEIQQDLGKDVKLDSVNIATVRGKMNYFRVRLDDPHYTAEIAEQLRGLGQVESVLEGRGIVERMVKIADIVKISGIAIAALLLFLAMFLISNTIRLMIYARRREIRIMQLVGATNWFIRLPLVFEGTVLGIVGGIIACVLVLGGAHYCTQLLLKSLDYLGTFSSGIDPLYTAGVLVGLGWIIGAIGSLVSIQKFLKA